MTKIVKGEKIRQKILEDLKKENFGKEPSLHIIYAGRQKASDSYIDEKESACKKAGFNSKVHRFEKNVPEDKVLKKINELNNNLEVHGILPQLPLPTQIEENKVFSKIQPEKDVDGLHPLNMGRLMRGQETLVPGTVAAILRILEEHSIKPDGRNVTIVNNSNLIGKPLSMALSNRKATVTVCNKRTQELEKQTREAEVLVTATGIHGLIDKEMVREGAVVIDAGYGREDGKPVGDTLESVKRKSSLYTPVPGGVGPVTVVETLRNLVKCYHMQKERNSTE